MTTKDLKPLLEDVLNKAGLEGQKKGVNLTPKRRNVLAILLQKSEPLSAYDIIELYRTEHEESLPATSVYRILNVLIEGSLVHKLETTNQYLACSHISCSHEHEIPQFLICDKCHSVEELGLHPQIVNELHDSVKKNGFTLANQQLELHGTCKKCAL